MACWRAGECSRGKRFRSLTPYPRYRGLLPNHPHKFHTNFRRLVLGLTEAPFYPGGIYLVSLFYTRKESATRLAIFYTGNMMASTFSGLIAAGVFAGLNGSHGLSGWRWLFLIQGVVTGMFCSSLSAVVSEDTNEPYPHKLVSPPLLFSSSRTPPSRPVGSQKRRGSWPTTVSLATLRASVRLRALGWVCGMLLGTTAPGCSR